MGIISAHQRTFYNWCALEHQNLPLSLADFYVAMAMARGFSYALLGVKMMAKRVRRTGLAARKSPHRDLINELDDVVKELYDFESAGKLPFLPNCYPDAAGLARLREHAFLILRLKRIDEDRNKK